MSSDDEIDEAAQSVSKAKLTRKRGTLKDYLTRFENFLSDKSNHVKITELEARTERLSFYLNEFQNVQAEIEMLDDSDAQVQEASEFENKYFGLVGKARELLEDNKKKVQLVCSGPNNSLPTACSSSSVQGFNLPPITIPPFDGNYEKWTSFHDVYVSVVHNNSKLSDSQKFYYLRSYLKGEAAKIIESLEISDANYNIAWDLLKKRFKNEKLMIKGHVKQVFDLPVVGRDYALRSFLDNFMMHFRALENLKEPVNSWSTILIYLLVSKIDYTSKREWEILTKDITSPTIEEFIKFLTDRCQILESVEPNSAKPSYVKKQFNHVSVDYKSCYICYTSDHNIQTCAKFLQLSVSDRINEIRRKKACTNCLKLGHISYSCKSNMVCSKCQKKHHYLLHYVKAENTNAQQNNDTLNSQAMIPVANNNSINTLCNDKKEKLDNCNLVTLLSTAEVYVLDAYENLVSGRALIDSGSQSNFITRKLWSELNIPSEKIQVPIVGINAKTSFVSEVVNLRLQSAINSCGWNLKFLIIDKITDNLPQVSFEVDSSKIPGDLSLADKRFNENAEIDILLGNSIFYELLEKESIRLGAYKPILRNSKLGWLVGGNLVEYSAKGSNICYFSKNLENQLEAFWKVEECAKKQNLYSREEVECEEHFVANFTRSENGKFIVRLPFRENDEKLGYSKNGVIKQFYNLEQKLAKKPEIKEKYVKFMNEYLEMNHMTAVSVDEEKKHCYLSHMSVLKESSITTKLRVVFNASQKTSSGLSLNDVLKVGPSIQRTLFDILLNFRIYPIAFTADIAKMYRCIEINEEDRRFQRIVWRSRPEEQLKHYVLNTVTYGTAPASFLATRCLKQLALENKNKFPLASESILNNFYMDDWLCGAFNDEEALQLIKQVSNILKGADFNLRQWTSNNSNIIRALSESEDQAHSSQFVIKGETSCKTLGISWNPLEDVFQLNVDNRRENKVYTKRSILSEISQIFDPLGLIGCVIVTSKIILQRLWQLKIGWDEPLPQNVLNFWLDFRVQLQLLGEINICRNVLIEGAVRIEMHVFSDASENAYGTCIYLRSLDKGGKVLVRLLCAKSRVAPLSKLTIPRLELCGALLAAELAKNVENNLKMNLDLIQFWSDSTIVLGWLRYEPYKLKTFVSNRIAKIQNLSNVSQWRYVPTEVNPADLISRGVCVRDIVQAKVWFEGPSWLHLESENWPKNILKGKDLDEVTEIKIIANLVSQDTESHQFINRWSSLRTILRVTSYILRFVHNASSKKEDRKRGNLTRDENDASYILSIKLVQNAYFRAEIKVLSSGNRISKGSKLISLDPFLDERGIVRVGGRLKHSNLEYDSKHQIILPSSSNFTNLIIKNTHLKYYHCGIQNTLNFVRQRFWPIRGKESVKRIINNCINCFRVKPKKFETKMGHLPADRVTPSLPFAVCGVDYAGPYLIKETKLRNKKFIKAYICIFVCFSSKAVHIELVSDLSAEGFLNALKRFVSRRGLCNKLYSDNASNFIGANNILKEFTKLSTEHKVSEFLLDNAIEWNYIPPRSPHFGGLWESAVRLTKFHLKRIMKDIRLTYEEFYSVLVQVESILNSRPLTSLTEDPEEYEVLTPAHFIIGRRMTCLPDPYCPDGRVSHVSRYRLIEIVKQKYWKQWSRSYLNTLQQRNKWRFSVDEPLVGELVLICDDTPTHQWKMGRIETLHRGSDGIPRVVTCKTKDGNIKRCVNKICLFPRLLKGGTFQGGRHEEAVQMDGTDNEGPEELARLACTGESKLPIADENPR